MSFSSDVKAEIMKQDPAALKRHCQIAQLSAFIIHLAKIEVEKETVFFIETDKPDLAGYICRLLESLFHCGFEPQQLSANKKKYRILLNEYGDIQRFLLIIKLAFPGKIMYDLSSVARDEILTGVCCKKSFIKASFLACGTMRDPDKGYRLEMVCNDMEQAEQIEEQLRYFDLTPKVTRRNDAYVVYLKEGAQVSDVFRIMGTNSAILEFENIRITREVRGNINRTVNCETANINKTVAAAMEQIKDIELIRERVGLESLPKELYDAAVARLNNEDVPLKDLGTMMNPSVGKSGMKHRFEKIRLLADNLRGI